MAHIRPDFKTKKAFKEAVKRGDTIYIYLPGGIFSMPMSGHAVVEAPAERHSWYAEVDYENFIITKVKS